MCAEAADAIDALLNRVSQLEAARIGYANEFPMDAEGLPNVGSIHENIRKLKAELEAAAADKRETIQIQAGLRFTRSKFRRGSKWETFNVSIEDADEAAQRLTGGMRVVVGEPHFCQTCNCRRDGLAPCVAAQEEAREIDRMMPVSALAQRQGEGS